MLFSKFWLNMPKPCTISPSIVIKQRPYQHPCVGTTREKVWDVANYLLRKLPDPIVTSWYLFCSHQQMLIKVTFSTFSKTGLKKQQNLDMDDKICEEFWWPKNIFWRSKRSTKAFHHPKKFSHRDLHYQHISIYPTSTPMSKVGQFTFLKYKCCENSF